MVVMFQLPHHRVHRLAEAMAAEAIHHPRPYHHHHHLFPYLRECSLIAMGLRAWDCSLKKLH